MKCTSALPLLPPSIVMPSGVAKLTTRPPDGYVQVRLSMSITPVAPPAEPRHSATESTNVVKQFAPAKNAQSRVPPPALPSLFPPSVVAASLDDDEQPSAATAIATRNTRCMSLLRGRLRSGPGRGRRL